MDGGFIAAIVTASIGALGTLVVMIIRAMKEKPVSPDSAPESVPRPPPSEHQLHPDLRRAIDRLDEIRELMGRQELSDAKTNIYDAELRKLCAEISTGVYNLVVAEDGARRDRAEMRADIRRLCDQQASIKHDIRSILGRRDRSSRP